MLGSVQHWLVIGGIFVVMLALMSLMSRRRCNRHVRATTPLTDDDYLGQVGAADDEAELYLAIRDIFAEQARIPAETIHPTQPLADILRLGLDGVYVAEVLTALGWKLDVRVGTKAVSRAVESEWDKDSAKDMTFGDLAGCLVRHWDEIIEASNQ